MCTFHLTMERADAVRGLARSVRPVLERFEGGVKQHVLKQKVLD